MSNNTNTSETNDPKHSVLPAPLLLDLDIDETSAPVPINPTLATTQMDEIIDTHNSPTYPDYICTENTVEWQQSGVPIDDNSMTALTMTTHQKDVEKDDSNDYPKTTSIEQETSDDIHIQSRNGLPQSDQSDDQHFDEHQVNTNQNGTDMNCTTPPQTALDDSNSSNTENGIIDQSLMDTNIQQEDDATSYDFDDNDGNDDNFDDFGKRERDNDNDFNDFGQMNENDDDDFGEFGDFGDFDQAGDLVAGDDDDDFGDFDDLSQPDLEKDNTLDTTPHEDLPLKSMVSTPSEPTLADQYIQLLQTDKSGLPSFIESTLAHLWTPVDESKDIIVESESSISGIPSPSQHNSYDNDGLLCTQCSLDLWQKVSRDSVFYNPITGSIGQFQWTRSEINRAYLNALGVRINYEDRLQDSGTTSMTSSPSLQHRHYSQVIQPSSTYGSSTNASASSSPSISKTNDRSANHMRSNSLTDNISLTGPAVVAALHGGVIPDSCKTPVEEEPELDIDIAKAYCELTEETIRVFPDVKLNAMVVELSRLQRQAKEYLGYLLDQREQLMMDAETYNDLISCIVGHAQRLREQNVAKDASPAMVSKKKKTTGLSGMIKRKNTGGTGGTSMGGGVVGVKQPSTSTGSKSTNSGVGRRSL